VAAAPVVDFVVEEFAIEAAVVADPGVAGAQRFLDSPSMTGNNTGFQYAGV